MKETRFKVVSSIQNTVTRELEAIREEALSWEFDLLYKCISDVNTVQKRVNFFVWFSYCLGLGT
jgi:hypothetical protein